MKKGWTTAAGIALVALVLAAYLTTTDLFKPRLDNPTLVLAHRAGSGHWPQNSRTAVHNAIAAAQRENPSTRYQGFEVDVVLTKDGVPVLSHDPWVHLTLCTTSAGAALPDKILIRDLTLAELHERYLCGGVQDEEFPEVIPKAETVMTLDEVLAALSDAPDMVLYLDVKIDGDLTASPQAYAEAILSRWHAAGLKNPLYMEGPSAASLAAYRAAAGATKLHTALSYPPFTADEKPTITVLKRRWLTKLGWLLPQDKAQKAKADAVVGPTQAISWPSAQQAREAGVQVILFTPNTKKKLHKFCGWPADIIITDFPELGHCPDEQGAL